MVEAGFVIRINGNQEIEVPGADVRVQHLDASLFLGENTFEVKTCDTSGVCSVWSGPAYYTASEVVTVASPTNLSVTKTP